MTSVNTNYGALVALQSLTQTTRELAEVQNRVNTGLKVASAKDNGAVFAIAEGQRARVASLGAVQDGIDRATSVIDVGLSAGEAIGDILKQLKEKAVAGQANDLSQDQRDALQADFLALRNQIDQIANAATFNGSNLVNGTNATGPTAFSVLTSDIGGANGSYALAGATLTDADTQPYSVHADLETATGLTFVATSQLRFSIDSADGSQTTTINVALSSGDTIQEFMDSVASQTGGRVTVAYNEETGAMSLRSNEAFDVGYYEADALADDSGVFGAGATRATMTGSPASAGSNQLIVSGFNFKLGVSGQALAGLTSALNISSAAGGLAASNAIDVALTALNKDLATMGAQSKALEVQKTFLGKLNDSIEAGIGNLVDADLAKESARLQALQVKQQLGAQALSIANSAPSIVLSFFR
jgi:flagellin